MDHQKSFDTANQCEAAPAAAVKSADEKLLYVDSKTHKVIPGASFGDDVLCIASDDPRLKGKWERLRMTLRHAAALALVSRYLK